MLDQILASKARDVEALRARPRKAGPPRSPLDIAGILRRGQADGRQPLRIVAEIKLRSPSAGRLSRALPVPERAIAYAEAGASMVSVLCDAPFFDGSWAHLEAARARLDSAGQSLPLLAKEFVLDGRQIEEARDRGADAVLLIARIVGRGQLVELSDIARSERIEPLVEVVDEHELESALAAGARVVGVNARDLDTLHMDATRTARVLAAIPPDVVAVHLSGLRDPDDVREVARGRADAALLGEALMRLDDPRPLLHAMLQAAR